MADKSEGSSLASLLNSLYGVTVVAYKDFCRRQQAKREPFYYYRREYRRVPTVDQCLEDDHVCIFEADMQYSRDRAIDRQIVYMLKEEMWSCYQMEGVNSKQHCKKQLADYEEAKDNFEIKYGGLESSKSSYKCLQKQKTRLLRERQQQQKAKLT